MKTLSVSLYNRPNYTQELFAHLDRCSDIDNYHIFICCEPGNDSVIKIAKSFRTNQTKVIINPTRYGCNLNIFQCFKIGFHYNDYHIHLEDDTIPAKDFLVYCEWCRHYFKNDPDIYSVCGYNKLKTDKEFDYSDPYSVIKKQNWFTPWGWATWIDRWENMIMKAMEESLKYQASWDCFVHNYQKTSNKYEIRPNIARIQNIGAENGSYCPGPAWHKENQYNEIWIESSQSYRNFFNVDE